MDLVGAEVADEGEAIVRRNEYRVRVRAFLASFVGAGAAMLLEVAHFGESAVGAYGEDVDEAGMVVGSEYGGADAVDLNVAGGDAWAGDGIDQFDFAGAGVDRKCGESAVFALFSAFAIGGGVEDFFGGRDADEGAIDGGSGADELHVAVFEVEGIAVDALATFHCAGAKVYEGFHGRGDQRLWRGRSTPNFFDRLWLASLVPISIGALWFVGNSNASKGKAEL